MCQDKECPQKNKCYRYSAIPSENLQSYFIETPRKENECDQYIPIKKPIKGLL